MTSDATPAKHERRSVARTAFQVIHTQRLWRLYGKAGADLVAAAVLREHGSEARISATYFQWLKSRYLAQRVLNLALDRLIKLTPENKARLKVLRSQMRRVL